MEEYELRERGLSEQEKEELEKILDFVMILGCLKVRTEEHMEYEESHIEEKVQRKKKRKQGETMTTISDVMSTGVAEIIRKFVDAGSVAMMMHSSTTSCLST